MGLMGSGGTYGVGKDVYGDEWEEGRRYLFVSVMRELLVRCDSSREALVDLSLDVHLGNKPGEAVRGKRGCKCLRGFLRVGEYEVV